jgi:hypothetical protein
MDSIAKINRIVNQVNNKPGIIKDYITNINDEIAEYENLVRNSRDEQQIKMQLEYIDLLIIDIEYMIKKITNKNE